MEYARVSGSLYIAAGDQGNYHPEAHLAEMIALLGPPPKAMIERERDGMEWRWAPPAQNAAGKMCNCF